MRYEFATAARIIFGNGTIAEVSPAARPMGSKALVAYSLSGPRTDFLLEDLAAKGIGTTLLEVSCEPSVESVQAGIQAARETGCDLVIAIGGGSAIDTGKAVSAMMANPGDLLDYLEVVGRGNTLSWPSAPFIAVPTTAGTGSEVTRNAVLGSKAHSVKASLRSQFMLPRLAIIDPELTYGLPPPVTASTGMDALTQLIEPYVSIRANAMTDTFAREGMLKASRALRIAFRAGQNSAARTDMCQASLLGGMCLANAGLGVVHGFAAPIGGMFPAPHGAICATILPHGMAVNIRALRKRAGNSEFLARYETVARILTGSMKASAEDGAAWAKELCNDLKIPPLGSYGINTSDADELVEKASRSSSMKGNPILLQKEELREILSLSL
jgi:alcohol dehydrogenase class IV